MKRITFCMLAVLLVATFSVPAAADQLPGVFSADMISSFANATCGQASATQPRFVGGVQTSPGNITIFVDFTNSLPTPVVSPALASGDCSTTIPLVPGASFDVCMIAPFTATETFIATITDTNKNGRIDGGEGFLSANFVAHGAAFQLLVLRAPSAGNCSGTAQFVSGFHRR